MNRRALRTLTEGKLSQAQQDYLLALARVFVRANKAEVERWGNKINWINEADVAAELRKSPDQIIKTANKVIDAGYAELKTKTVHGSKLRYGAYGKWIGGAKRTTQVIRSVRPTKAGVELVKSIIGGQA